MSETFAKDLLGRRVYVELRMGVSIPSAHASAQPCSGIIRAVLVAGGEIHILIESDEHELRAFAPAYTTIRFIGGGDSNTRVIPCGRYSERAGAHCLLPIDHDGDCRYKL